MGSLSGASVVARNAVLIAMAMPLVGLIMKHLYDQYGVMKPSQAVVILGLIGGSAQIAIQGVGAGRLESLSRDVNVLELLPAVGASVATASVVTWLLLPPNPNPVTATLDASGALPS